MMNHEIKKQYFFRSQDNVGAYRNHPVCSLKLYPITSGFMGVQPLIFPRPDPSSRNAITFTFLQNTVIQGALLFLLFFFLFFFLFFSSFYFPLFFSVLLRWIKKISQWTNFLRFYSLLRQQALHQLPYKT